MTDTEINTGEIRRFQPNSYAFVTREKFGPELTRTSDFRCVGVCDDPGDCGEEVRAAPVPNPCKPLSAGLSWFSRKEWLTGEIITSPNPLAMQP